MLKKIKWGQLNLIGLDENNLNVYNTKHLNAIENGKSWHLNKSDDELEQINKKKSESHTGLKNTKEARKKISKALKGKPKSKKHKENLSKSKIGKKQSAATIEKKKKVFSGKGNPMYNKHHSKKSRKLISANHGSKTIKKCPYCDKECGLNNYPRWHGDNCKMNPNKKPQQN